MEAAIPFEIKDRLEMEIAEICQALLAEEGVTSEALPKASFPSLAIRPSDMQVPSFWWPKPQTNGRQAR
jgi:hypothetical protein